MSKLLIFNFDGTSNDPSDASQDVDYKGAKEDDNITNILKFHLMLGGDLLPDKPANEYESSWDDTNQRVFYYHGVGTYGSQLKRLYNAALSAESSDVATILNQALGDFDESFLPGDTLLVAGFSRGAALARRFVALIDKKTKEKSEIDSSFKDLKPFVYEAMYDTVASIGIPNMSKADRPVTEVLFEDGHSLPKNVLKALHCVSMDDKRKIFQPTLMNYQKGVVHEVWFAGAHSDVGGGYYRDRLSDISLEYFLQWVSDNVPEVRYGMPTEERLLNILPNDVDYEIGLDDILRNPSPFGKNHQQGGGIVDWLMLTDRLCCVIEDNKASKKRPMVHWSVASRINGDGDYRPKSLKNKKHTVVYADERSIDSSGMATHIETPRSDLRYLPESTINENQTEIVTVFASQRFNHSGLMLEKGGTYRFTVEPNQTWHDGNVKNCGPDGWNRENRQLGLAEFKIAILEPFRRVSDADWFCLCGCVTDNDDYAFVIGSGPVEHTIEKTGEFLPFANDKNTHYGNNEGKIKIVVQRVS